MAGDASDFGKSVELFHGLIRARAAEFGGSLPERLPTPEAGHGPDDPEWFAVPGMYGGSGQRHVIEKGRCELVAEGFA